MTDFGPDTLLPVAEGVREGPDSAAIDFDHLRDLAAERREDEATLRDLYAERHEGLTRRDGAL